MKTSEQTAARLPGLVVVACLILIAGASLIGDALFAPYAINGDVVSYFDLADQVQQHHWAWVVNGYWNPLYPALLAAARLVTHADVWHEMRSARLLNIGIGYLVLLASVYLADSAYRLSIERVQPIRESAGFSRLPRPTLLISAFTITFWLIVRNMNMNQIRPDLLLSLFLLIAFAALLNILRTGAHSHFALLGAAFALAFLTKSVAFPLFAFTAVLLILLAFRRRSDFAGVALAALVFAVVAGPLIYALSKKAGHFSSGESGGDNYAWYVDGAERFDQQHGEPETKGSAVDRLIHTSRQVLAHPPVYDYGTWMPGTETQWFDPSYWNAGLTPKFAAGRQATVVMGNIIMLARLTVMNFQIFLPLILLALTGAYWARSDWSWQAFGPAALVALALVGLFLLVLVEGRYIAPSFVVLITGALAFAYVPDRSATRAAIWCSALMLLASLVFTDIQDWARTAREQTSSEGTSSGSYNREIWTAAQSLISNYGIHPGDRVACYGEGACRDDVYWARLVQANIRTEVYSPQDDVLNEWNKDGHNPQFIPALESTGAKVLVAKFPAGSLAPSEWKRLGQGDLYVIDLRAAPPTPPGAG